MGQINLTGKDFLLYRILVLEPVKIKGACPAALLNMAKFPYFITDILNALNTFYYEKHPQYPGAS